MKRKIARLFIPPVLGSALLSGVCVDDSNAIENSVVVESKTVRAGVQDVRLGVFISNADWLSVLTLPLEFRSVDQGGFTVGGSSFVVNPSGRIANDPGFLQGGCANEDPVFTRQFPAPDDVNYCSGPVSGSYDYPAGVDPYSITPDAHLMRITADCSMLRPGVDTLNPDSASLFLYFDVASRAGEFVIDTCCATLRHLLYLFNFPPAITPQFTQGVVTVLPPCGCPCQADPECDGVSDMVDVVLVIDRAFRGADAVTDSVCIDSSGTDGLTDVDCSQATNILDVVRIIDVALRGASADTSFCRPCGEGAARRGSRAATTNPRSAI